MSPIKKWSRHTLFQLKYNYLMVRSTLLPIQLHTGPKGETRGITSIYSVDNVFDIFEDPNFLNIIKVSYGQVSDATLLKP